MPSHLKKYVSAHGYKFYRFLSVTFVSSTAVLSFSHSFSLFIEHLLCAMGTHVFLMSTTEDVESYSLFNQQIPPSLRETKNEPEVVTSCDEGGSEP